MTAKRSSWWRRRLRGAGRERGMVEAGIAAAGGLLVVGAVLGNGVAAAVMDMSDGQTWVPSNDGSVVQINPATGQPEFKLTIGEDGDRLEVTQSDGYLVVTNLDTGVMTPIDLASLAAGQSRLVDADTEILIGGGLMVVAEKEPGFVQVVDPIGGHGLGAPYRAGEDVSDVVIDREGSIWLMTTSGSLRELDWDGEARTFSVSTDREISGAGPDTRLVPHASGVTVFAPDGGAVLQIGAGTDYVQQVPALQGSVLAAAQAPATLSPASATDSGLVFMISGRNLVTVDVAAADCSKPLTPAVFEDRVYVPCGGVGRVLVLDAQGKPSGEPIQVPGGGDAQLIVDDGRLIVHTPDDGRIVVVQQDGSTQITDLTGAEVPTGQVDASEPLPPITTPTDPTTPPTTPPVTINPPLTTPTPTEPTGTPTEPATGEPTQNPTGGPGGSEDGDPALAPTGVTASITGTGSVRLVWTAPQIAPRDYRVQSSDGAVQQTLPVSQTSVELSNLTCGTTVTLTVLARHADGTFGQASAAVDTPDCVGSPRPADHTATGVVAERAGDDILVGWTAPPVTPARYVVTGMGLSQTVAGGSQSVVFGDVPCGEPIRFEVTAVHPTAGEYTAASGSRAESCTVDPADLQPRNVTLTRVSGDDYRLTWQPPVQSATGYRISGSGIAQTVAAGTTSLDVTIACAASVQLTVTADHTGGATGAAISNALTNTCTVPLTAPSNVTATQVDVDTVQVTWTPSSPAADEYVVIPNPGGGTVSAGTATSANVDVTPGATYTFTVRATSGSQTATSSASNSVAVAAPATVPGTPSGATASYTDRSGTSSVTVAVSWTAPADGGSPITGYALSWDGGSTTVAGTSASVTIPCSGQPLCTSGGTTAVSISAVNGVGQSGAATATATIPAAPVPVPQDGDPVLDGQVAGDNEAGEYSATFTYTPTATWASTPGTCTISVNGGAAQAINCSTPTTVYGGRGWFVDGLWSEASVTFTGAGFTATSYASAEAAPQPWCNPRTGVCYEIRSLPADPDVQIDPLPWAPPEVPNPPVLFAGVGMLVGAGTLRTLRALRRRGLLETPADDAPRDPSPARTPDARTVDKDAA